MNRELSRLRYRRYHRVPRFRQDFDAWYRKICRYSWDNLAFRGPMAAEKPKKGRNRIIPLPLPLRDRGRHSRQGCPLRGQPLSYASRVLLRFACPSNSPPDCSQGPVKRHSRYDRSDTDPITPALRSRPKNPNSRPETQSKTRPILLILGPQYERTQIKICNKTRDKNIGPSPLPNKRKRQAEHNQMHANTSKTLNIKTAT